MFSIYDGRTQFYQWDRDRKLIVNDPTITKVHFCNRTGSCSLVRCVYEVNGMYLVDVPNIILQESYRINVYGYDNEYTKHSNSFNIVPRTKPEDYVYTDAELAQWEALEERVAAIEENGVSQETINEAVEEYLNEHPIQSGATEEEKAQIAANTEEIAAIKEDYASQLYVAAAISDLELEQFALKTDIPSLKGYATEAYVDEAVANVNVDVDFSNYYTKEETDNAIAAEKPDMSFYYFKDEVDAAINAAKPDLTAYATEEWVVSQKYLTEHQALSEYALKKDIPDHSQYLLKRDFPDHTQYALKGDIPDVSKYTTEETVLFLIDMKIASITDGEEVSY